MEKIGNIIGYILGACFIALVIYLIYCICTSFFTIWFVLHGWFYLLVLVSAFLLLILITKTRLTTSERTQLIEASKKEKEEYEKYKEDIRKRLKMQNLPIEYAIAKLKSQKEAQEQIISNNTVLFPSQLDNPKLLFGKSGWIESKVFSLIRYLETNQADSINEALFLFNKEDAELYEQAKKRYAEKERAYKEEMFRQEQLSLLREQNKKIEEAKREQSDANKKIISQAEELLKKANNEN